MNKWPQNFIRSVRDEKERKTKDGKGSGNDFANG